MAIERFAPTVYLTRANLRSSPGPLVEKFAICVDGPDGIYRFAIGDTTADDDWTAITPQGGAAGTWLLIDHAVAALADLPDAAATGARIYVTGRRSWYQYSGSAWVRTTDTDPAWAQSTDVYVNYSTGSDDAAGTALAPLATVTEAFLRLGTNRVASTSYFTIHQTGNATETSWDLSANTTSVQSVTIQGVPTVALSTTVTVGAWDASTNTYGTLTGASSLAAYAATSASTNGRCFRVVGGDRDGLHGVLRLHLGSGVVQYELAAALWTPGGSELVTGDTIEVLTLPTMPDAMRVRAGTTVFFAYLSGLSGTHAAVIESHAAAWFTACEFSGDIDGTSGSFHSLVACSMAAHALRCEEAAGYLEIYESRVFGIAARSLSRVHLGNVTLEELCTANEGAIIYHDTGHVWLMHTSSTGAIIELYPRASWISSATAGVICGTGLLGGAPGTIRLRSGSAYIGTTPVFTGTGTAINVAGTAKAVGDVASYFAANGASIGPRV